MTKIYHIFLINDNFPISDFNYYGHVVIARNEKEARNLCPKDEPAWMSPAKSRIIKIGLSTLKPRMVMSG